MKIGLVELTKLIEDCKRVGFDVKMSDIAYVMLVDYFKDKSIPYKILFNKETSEKEIRDYNKNKYTRFLKKYIDTNFLRKEEDILNQGKNDNSQKYEDISFEENKDAIIKLISEAEEKYKKHEIEWDKYSDRVSKLRIALNDRFKVSEKKDEQRVIVYKKYNDICVCGREIYRPTRDDIIEDLKLTYDLVPKQVNTEEENGENNEREDEEDDR